MRRTAWVAAAAAAAALAVPVAASVLVNSPVAVPADQVWTAAPLKDGGLGRAKSSCAPWDSNDRTPDPGEIFVMVDGGAGWSADNRRIRAVWPLGSVGKPYSAIYLYEDCLEGVAHV